MPIAAPAPARATPDAGARNTDVCLICVDADKRDRMIDLVGERIIAVATTAVYEPYVPHRTPSAHAGW